MRAGEKTLFCGAVSMGNPHVVTVVDDVDTADVDTLGPLLESHERFPEPPLLRGVGVISPAMPPPRWRRPCLETDFVGSQMIYFWLKLSIGT